MKKAKKIRKKIANYQAKIDKLQSDLYEINSKLPDGLICPALNEQLKEMNVFYEKRE